MKRWLAVTYALACAASAGAQDEIVVEAQRLSASEVADTTLVMERGRNNRVEIKIRANGHFKSYWNGLDSDWGTWSIRGEQICFEGRTRGSFCGNLAGRKVGDRWIAKGLDGKDYEARLLAGA